ncbi:hypothetical protein ACQ4PT_005784 [Festuca glaucescens]
MPDGPKNKKVTTADGEDRLGALPDEIFQHVLSFLPSCQTATNLELITHPEMFIFRKDLKRRPFFTKLKTLLLNEWCVAANFAALVYFLQHTNSGKAYS